MLPDAIRPSLAVLVAAILLDLVAGELPARLHPVVWMGRVAALGARAGRDRGPTAQLVIGAVLALAVPALFAAATWALLVRLAPLPPLRLAAAAVIFSSTFAIRGLGRAAADVRGALARGALGEARFGLRSLCSRDATTLDADEIVAATVESVAENASDSIVAPLVYYAAFGVPGAVLYRAVNTLDSMIGYRGRYEYLGKAAARLDDAINFIPARLTAALLLAAGWLAGDDSRRGWRVLARDGGRTASPNAGRPMAVMAGLLGVALEKRGDYRLGDADEALAPGTIDRAWRLVTLATSLAVVVTAVAIEAMHAGA